MKALIPQGLTGRPNYFGLLNNLINLIICESLREIGGMACVTSAWSARGQTLKETGDINKSNLFMDLYSPTDIFYFQDFVFPIVGQISSGYHKKQFILSSDLSGITAG